MLSVLVFRGVVLLCFVNSILSSEVAVRSGRTCARNGHITVELQCSVNERIHVAEERYGYGQTNSCQFPTNGSCEEVLQTSIHGLAVNCNGKESCNETASPVTCNFAAAAHAEVHYKCINDSMDICGFDTMIVAANESVYLHSPGYPYSVGLNNSCVVRVTGKGIQLTIAEQSLNGGTLTISGNGNKKWSNVNATLYNRKLTEQSSEVAIFYTDGGNDRSNVWISVIGSSPMSVTFNGGMLTSSVTSTLLVPMSEGSMPQHDVSSQRMSVTQSGMPANTLFTNTQTMSTVSTSALFTTIGTDPISVTATATVEMTAQTTVTTVRIAPSTTSDAETMTVGMTLNETTHTPQTPDESDEDVVVIVASICACCGVVVIVVVVVAVVLCRCKTDKVIRSATSHNGGIDRQAHLSSRQDTVWFAKA
ncbi:uncharacterized protein [Haliotis asinina]|uniref:uncharacterized protein n=1 Tax=Haliotis asinina TaxID=109174 RepID=UPI00353216DE